MEALDLRVVMHYSCAWSADDSRQTRRSSFQRVQFSGATQVLSLPHVKAFPENSRVLSEESWGKAGHSNGCFPSCDYLFFIDCLKLKKKNFIKVIVSRFTKLQYKILRVEHATKLKIVYV